MVKILAYVNLYPPSTRAGAELMLHETLLALRDLGHEVMVAQPNPPHKLVDGIRIIKYSQVYQFDADIVFTQNHDTQHAIAHAKSIKKPIVHFVHNDQAVKLFRLNASNCDLVVANSQWVYNSIRINNLNKMIVNPHTNIDFYKTHRPDANKITFINLIDIKGVNIFWRVAEILGDREFLAVKGGYGNQIVKKLGNVRVVENTGSMRSIYAQTKIFFMPSKYESWGRAAVEAMASGIPVVASRTPGLLESVADAGMFAEPDDVNVFIRLIKSLDDERTYEKYSRRAELRAIDLSKSFSNQIGELHNAIVWLCGKE